MGTVAVVAIRDTALSVEEVLDAVGDDGSGGTVVFVGRVRDHDEGRSVTRLTYEAHPRAEAAMQAVAERVAAMEAVRAVAAVHRIGDLAVGDLAVVVAVSCAHRGEAFDAASRLIDGIKAETPIWKLQRFLDGDDHWVAAP